MLIVGEEVAAFLFLGEFKYLSLLEKYQKWQIWQGNSRK